MCSKLFNCCHCCCSSASFRIQEQDSNNNCHNETRLAFTLSPSLSTFTRRCCNLATAPCLVASCVCVSSAGRGPRSSSRVLTNFVAVVFSLSVSLSRCFRFVRCQQHFFNWFRLLACLVSWPCPNCACIPACVCVCVSLLPQLLTRCCCTKLGERD